jgi:hypothetical protein
MELANLLTSQALFLAGAGFVLGAFSIVVGGGMFFSVPLMQWLFPGVTFGAIIGNIKVGSFFRSFASTVSTHSHIEYKQNFKLAAIGFIGATLGASTIANLDQRWLFPAIIVAVTLATVAPKLAHKITDKTYYFAAFLTGLYSGFFGAGVGIFMIALLRLKHPADTDIALVKIQARFVEWLMIITAMVTHLFHGNIIAHIALPWAAGSLLGGYYGGVLLKKMGRLPGKTQKYILYVAFGFALLVAGIKFF